MKKKISLTLCRVFFCLLLSTNLSCAWRGNLNVLVEGVLQGARQKLGVQRTVSFRNLSIPTSVPAPGVRTTPDPQSAIGKYFFRILTKGEDNREPVRINQQKAFMHQHWLNVRSFRWRELTKPDIDLLDPDITSEHRKFREELQKKLETSQKSDAYKLLHQLPEPLNPTEKFKKSEVHNKGAFIDGHMIQTEEITKYPKFFITLFSADDLKEGRKFETTKDFWLVPLEQAFLCKTLGEYRKSIALLKMWSAYSQFGLVYIPQGTRILHHSGIIAPQVFPYLDIDSLKKKKKNHVIHDGKYDVKKTLKNIGVPTESREILYEYVEGGATQFLLLAAEKREEESVVEIFKLDVFNSKLPEFFPRKAGEGKGLDLSELEEIPNEKNKQFKIADTARVRVAEDSLRYWDGINSTDGENRVSHLIWEDYDTQELDFAKGLLKLGLLTPQEYKELSKIRDYIIAHREVPPIFGQIK